jgi:hypothetical protein
MPRFLGINAGGRPGHAVIAVDQLFSTVAAGHRVLSPVAIDAGKPSVMPPNGRYRHPIAPARPAA